MNLLLALPVLLPLGGAAITLLLRHHPRIQLGLTVSTLAAILGVAITLGLVVPEAGVLVLQIGNWTRSSGSCWSPTG